ncbi:MAG: formylglycine-generating enzyme family protein [Nitrospiraceae bacterium]
MIGRALRLLVAVTLLLASDLFLDSPAFAQLDRLRRSKALELPPTVETTMVEIPEGPFTMGFDGTQSLEDERPKHQVRLPTFFMDLHEVTTMQYASFLAATNRDAPWQWNGVDLSQHRDRPVIGVDWSDAVAYCVWKGKRLPTEAEWEKSARGTDAMLYPWGNQAPSKDLANFASGARFSYSQVLMPVQSYEQGKSPYGLYHMAGNVWEWVQDWYGVNYYEVSMEYNPQGPEQGQFKVLRGGSWSDLPKYLLTYGRFKLSPETRNSHTGFRCAKS